MAKIDRDKFIEICRSGDEELIATLADDVEKRINTKKYGLVWEEGGDDENSPFECENVVKEIAANIPVPRIREDLSTNIKCANGNMLLEGDNYAWLKILEQTHAGKIDVVYIDPPYNTGNKDFKYNDSFVGEDDVFKHSKWLSFMSSRLKIAYNLLVPDGLIFISIDDREFAQVKMLCDEIFGPSNFIGTVVWGKKRKGSFLSKGIISLTEYLIVYSKNKEKNIGLYGGAPDATESQPIIKRTNKVSQLNIKSGQIKTKLKNGVYKAGIYGDKVNPVKLLTDVYVNDGVIINDFTIEAPFIWTQETYNEEIEKGGQAVINTMNFQIRVFRVPDEKRFKGFPSYINGIEISGTNEDAFEDLEKIFNIKNTFSYSKPTNYIKMLIEAATHFNKDAQVLDFFAGSGTTAQAVMELNKEDGGNRKWILITNNEDQDADDGDPDTGICRDITKPRIDTIITGKRLDGSTYSEGIENVGYQYFQYDFIPRIRHRYEKNAFKFFQPYVVDSMISIKHGVSRTATDEEKMLCVYESDGTEVVAAFQDIDVENANEIAAEHFGDEREHILFLPENCSSFMGITEALAKTDIDVRYFHSLITTASYLE